MERGRIRWSDLSDVERACARAIVLGGLRFVATLVVGVAFLALWIGGITLFVLDFSRVASADPATWSYVLIFFMLVVALLGTVIVLVHNLFQPVFRLARAVEEQHWHMRTPREVEELTESRREIVAAFEIERRRIERDLHDGAQQFLVTASMDVGEASLLLETAMEGRPVDPDRLAQVSDLLTKAQDDAEAALRALRTTVAGIHPKVLSDLGLHAAVENLCSSSALDVTLRVPHELPTLPEGVVAAGYFLVSEALTNAAKYAPHSRASVLIVADDDLHISVTDEGPGGATIRPDGGLSGMRERLAAFGGTLTLTSPPGGPTTVSGSIPLLLHHGEFGVTPEVNVSSALPLG
ncbi:MAG: histidine kinase [Actinomycetaceae bacterium]|nr:histidine kinase [Actinomycetaceae bacterium]